MIKSSFPTNKNSASTQPMDNPNVSSSTHIASTSVDTKPEKKIGSPTRSPQQRLSLPPALAKLHPVLDLSAPEHILTKNLLQHLNVGSLDSFNIIRSTFEFKGYSTALLDKYIKNKSPENFKALATQIECNLFT